MSTARDRRRLGAVFLVLALAGCGASRPPMYAWDDFPRQQYDVLRRDGVSALDQIQAMQAHAQESEAEGAALPPGFRAHLGLLQLNVGNIGAARESWLAEKKAFPESAPYVDSLLKRIESPTQPASKEDPA